MKKFLVILMLVSVLAVAAFSQNKPGSYIVRSQNWEYGLLDSVGNVLIPVEFSRISSLKSGFLKVCDKEGCSMYRADGELVLGEKVYDIEVLIMDVMQSVKLQKVNGLYIILMENLFHNESLHVLILVMPALALAMILIKRAG